MAKVYAIGKTEIRVYANDHLPPHFHIVHPDFEVLIEISESMLGGLVKALPAKMRWNGRPEMSPRSKRN